MHPEFSNKSPFALPLPTKISIWLLALLSASFLGACKKSGPDISTPKKAAALFARAAQDGDAAMLHKVATGTDAEFELCKGLGQVMVAFNKFAAAASNKFGTDASHVNDMSINLMADSDEAEEKIDGDTALLIPKPHGAEESEPYKLKKDKDGWKLDLSFLDRDARARQISEKLPAVASVWDQAAADVEAGKFAIFSDAKAAVLYRIDIASSDDATARQKIVRYDIKSLENALDEYKKDAAEYPSTADGLLALTEKPVTASNWHGPYLKKTIVDDPWGHRYVYISPGRHNTNGYDLHSMGADGMDDTADDIANFDTDAK